MNVSNDTNLPPSESSVRSMKSSLNTIVPRDSRYKSVNRYTRAGMWGREIVCPRCDASTTVYHFSWSALECQWCKSMVNKNDWWTL